MSLHKIKIQVNEVGRGVIQIDDQEIHGVVDLSFQVKPGLEFTAVTFTVIGSLEAEIVVADENVRAFTLGAITDDPEAELIPTF